MIMDKKDSNGKLVDFVEQRVEAIMLTMVDTMEDLSHNYLTIEIVWGTAKALMKATAIYLEESGMDVNTESVVKEVTEFMNTLEIKKEGTSGN